MKRKRTLLTLCLGAFLFLPEMAAAQWLRVAAPQRIRALGADGPNLYAGTTSSMTGAGDAALFVSTDQGASWKQLGSAGWPKPNKKGSGGVGLVSQVVVTGAKLLLVTDSGILLSRDTGTNWTAAAGFAEDPTVYCVAAGSGRMFAGTQRRVFVSEDGGLSWTPAGGAGLPKAYIEQLVAHSTGLFAGTFYGIWASRDNGANWVEANSGIPGHREVGFPEHRDVVCLGASGPYVLASVDQAGVFRSSNGGASWTPAGAGLPANAGVWCFASTGGKLLAGLYEGGVYVSSDNGGSWTAMNAGWAQAKITVNSLAAADGQLFAGVYNAAAVNYEVWRWPLSAGPEAGGETAQTYFENGQRAFRDGDFANAVLLFGKTIEKDPKMVPARLERARSYLKLGGRPSYDSALADATKVLELEPSNTEAFFVRGEVYRGLAYFALDKGNQSEADGLLAKAIADYRVALQADPGSRAISLSMAHAQTARGELDSALAVYAKYFEQDPRSEDLTRNLRDVFDLYLRRKTVPDCGGFKHAWQLAGRFYSEKKDYRLAVQCLSKAIELGLADWSVYWDRSQAYEYQKDFARALADVDMYIKVSPNENTYAWRAELAFKAGALDRAIADYSEAIKLQLKSIKALPVDYKLVYLIELYSKRAAVYESKQDWNAAIGDYKAIGDRLLPGAVKAKVLYRMGLVYQNKGDAKNARKFFDQALAMDPGLKKSGEPA